VFVKPQLVDTNGIRLAVYEAGAGPPVVFLHGFPELACSWRFQLPALAAAGYRAIAPDLRGYGLSSVPADVGDYALQEGIADLHGLLDALELSSATFVGHDWGALLLWQMVLLAPERIDRLVALNIPLMARAPIEPIAMMRQRFGERFYIVDFQHSREADRLFDADPARVIDHLMRKNQLSRAQFEQLPPEKKIVSLIDIVSQAPSGDPVLEKDELAFYAAAFGRTGFTGPINWYRNWTRNWEALADGNYHVDLPVLFIGATDDVLIPLELIENMRPMIRNLEVHMLEPCGHWTQQERPDDVNRLLIDWLARS
jgi:pimeloyl-ACP methyl ester carboxylesterase